MAEIRAQVTSSRQVWESPDGQRKLYEVMLSYNGQEFKAKTYSGAIAQEGWQGTVVTENRPDKRGGSEIYVKQPPKEGFGQSGGFQPSTGQAPQTTAKPAYQPKDEAAIKAMWSIGQSIQAHNSWGADKAMNLDSVKGYAVELFEMVDEVKQGKREPDGPATDTVVEVDDGPLDFSMVDEILSGAEELPSTTETPWTKK